MKKRLIIKEDERNEILNLHKKYINEQYSGNQTGTQTTTGAQTTTGSNVQTTTEIPQDQMKAKIEMLQTKLNEKYQSGLVVDGKWGPKTAAAVAKALSTANTDQTPSAGTTPTAETTPVTPNTDASRFQQNAQNLLNQNPLKRP